MANEIPTEALEAAARAALEFKPGSYRSYHMNDEETAILLGDETEAAAWIIAAAAPYLIAEGRRQAAADIRAEAQREIDTQGSWFWFVHGETGLKSGAEWAARIAEGSGHG